MSRMEYVIWKSGLLHDQMNKLVNFNCICITIASHNTGMSKAAYIDAVLSGVDEALHNNSDIIVK